MLQTTLAAGPLYGNVDHPLIQFSEGGPYSDQCSLFDAFPAFSKGGALPQMS